MDPTKTPGQSPLKASLDEGIYFFTTYLMPISGTCVLLLRLEETAMELLAVCTCGSVYFWAIVCEATWSYRRQLAVPKAVDCSLDPFFRGYLEVLLFRFLFAVPLPLAAMWIPLPGPQVTFRLTLGLAFSFWLFFCLRELAYEQKQGRYRLPSGTLGIHLKPVELLRNVYKSGDAKEPQIPWGGILLGLRHLLTNFLLIGSIGSGKTLVMKQFMYAVLPLILRYKNWRALIIDPKWEFSPYVQALLPRYKVKMFNPGYCSYVWDASKDLRDKVKIFAAAESLVQQRQNESQPFFTNAARRILFAVILAFAERAPKSWHFSDVMLALQSTNRLQTLLSQHHETREILQLYARNQRVFYDVYATLDTEMAPYYPVAAAWSHQLREYPTRTFSLTDWVQGNYALLIGKQASAGAAHSRIIELLLLLASQLLLDQQTGQSTLQPEQARRTVVIIDELARLGKLEILFQLLSNGRDYGVASCCAAQSVDALVNIYGKDLWNALENEFHTLALLSSNSPNSVEWMARRVGKNQPQAIKKDNYRPAHWVNTLDPSEFQSFLHGKSVGPDCVPAVFLNSQIGAWYGEQGVDIPDPLARASALEPIPDKWKTIRTWDDEDLRRLNLFDLRDDLDLDGGAPSPAPRNPSGPLNPSKQRQQYPRFRA